ncbi:MAG: CsbD family protein [Nocardia sp.]|uniref:CsbD family protein n=1 Tax=Nocardia sp. TaxID=1821 RepID=UPI00260B38B7|nr:CsbD family protein [Nocardia sp.]MCU1641935.1 CsbD family protein [Nocardia sp.]
MSIGGAIAHRAKITRGTIKQFVGRAIGDTQLRNQGRLDRATGNAARAVDKLGNALKP